MLKVAVAGLQEETKNYVAALKALGTEPVVTLEAEGTEGFAGLLLPGGGDIDPELFGAENEGSTDIDRELDEKQLAIARMFVEAKKPVLGICKGHQIINVLFGGGIIQDIGSAARHSRVNGSDSVHESTCEAGSILHELYGSVYFTNSAHHQGLSEIGEGLRAISHSDDGVVEAVAHETLPVIGLQWHPERMCFAHRRVDTVDGAKILEHFVSLMEG